MLHCDWVPGRAIKERKGPTPTDAVKSVISYLDLLDVAIQPLGTILSRICLAPACRGNASERPRCSMQMRSTAALTLQAMLAMVLSSILKLNGIH